MEQITVANIASIVALVGAILGMVKSHMDRVRMEQKFKTKTEEQLKLKSDKAYASNLETRIKALEDGHSDLKTMLSQMDMKLESKLNLILEKMIPGFKP